ncbi:hypothetical protein CALVIDRAFT_558497 [Calocera viscosa TUFC12733]|uniref:Glycosyltransferase 61 catalytic domain-containing protein n=1 Tax=Calocera viscosa (strain TUFC12733) TaxID=1330018 RepID=A0A167GQU3_CALVF|nr:hypothetical protein CALVIDRAFT_558497 [Calocera viscosa TUFC12733]
MSVLAFFGRRLRGVVSGLFTVAGLTYIASKINIPTTVTTATRSLNQWSIPHMTYRGDDLFGSNDGSAHQGELVAKDGSFAPTKLLVHAAGNGIFERLYVHGGTLYFVTDHPDSVPDIRFITSSGGRLQDQPRPTSQDFDVISPDAAQNLFSPSPIVLSGTTFFITENAQFAAHYYHFGAASGRTTLAAPNRLMYSHVNSTKWRDRAHMVPFMVRAMFGSIEMSFAEDWSEMASMDYTFVFDRVVLFDRWAAQNGPNSGRVRKCTAEAFSLGHVEHFWEPIRQSAIQFADRAKGMAYMRGPTVPVVTYVSRQSTKRRLVAEDHDGLVQALTDAQEILGYELRVAQMENISKADQIKLSSQTTIMLGVHGNGLSNMLWMERSSRSTVMEIHFPQAFVVDYEVAAMSLGHQYRGFWNDTYFIEQRGPQSLKGMHGSNIVIHAPTVISAIAEILNQP